MRSSADHYSEVKALRAMFLRLTLLPSIHPSLGGLVGNCAYLRSTVSKRKGELLVVPNVPPQFPDT